MQGRAFGFLALLGGSWILARIGIATDAVSGQGNGEHVRERPLAARPNFESPAITLLEHTSLTMTESGSGPMRQRVVAKRHILLASLTTTQRKREGLSPEISGAVVSTKGSPTVQGALFLPPPVGSMMLPGAVPTHALRQRRPFDVYAYSFWRSGNAPAGILGNGQYGGSQSAFILNVPLFRFRANPDIARLALTGRYAFAHDNAREQEWAAGVRWRPAVHVPVNIIAERRFRHDRPDAFALFVAGGQSNVALPLKFRLDSYGQAGVVSGSSGGAFADLVMQARRPVAIHGPAKLSAGVGAWAGGQDNVMRLDLGPSIAADMPIAGAQFRLEANWRFRVAGDADPGNGPAVTLSTSF